MEDFRVGDVVRLRNYNGHNDWIEHTGHEAVIIEIQEGGIRSPLQYRYHIRWPDDVVSSAPLSNLMPRDFHAPLRTATQAMHNYARENSDPIQAFIERELQRKTTKQVEVKKYRNFSEFLKSKGAIK